MSLIVCDWRDLRKVEAELLANGVASASYAKLRDFMRMVRRGHVHGAMRPFPAAMGAHRLACPHLACVPPPPPSTDLSCVAPLCQAREQAFRRSTLLTAAGTELLRRGGLPESERASARAAVYPLAGDGTPL